MPDFNVGDRVFVSCWRYSKNWLEVDEIQRMTPTGQIVTKRYRFKDGAAMGLDAFYFVDLKPWSAELQAKYEYQRALELTEETNFKKLDREQVIAISQIISGGGSESNPG